MTSFNYHFHIISLQSDDEMEMKQLRGTEHEAEPKNLEVGVCIKNLTKIYNKVSRLMTLLHTNPKS